MAFGRRVAVTLLMSTVWLHGCSAGPDDGDEAVAGAVDEVSSEAAPADSTVSESTTGSVDATESTTSTEATEPPPESSDPTGEVYISTFDPNAGSDLHRLLAGETEPVTTLVSADGPVQLTDIALSSEGMLYGSTFGQLVRIDLDSGDVEMIATLASGQVNALTFLPDGRLLAAGLDGVVSFVDTETGEMETLTSYPSGLVSSGDLAADEDGTVYATATDRTNDYLLTIDPDSGEVETRSTILPFAVYGLTIGTGGELVGLTFETATGRCDQGEMIAISADGAGYESLDCLDFTPGGAAG